MKKYKTPINKKQYKKNTANFKGATLTVFKGTFHFVSEDGLTKIAVQVDKNNGICDIQPRIADFFNHFHGRQFDPSTIQTWLDLY